MWRSLQRGRRRGLRMRVGCFESGNEEHAGSRGPGKQMGNNYGKFVYFHIRSLVTCA
jgi:hypothetical protein